MKVLLLIARVIVSVFALGVAAFCAFGFLAATVEAPNLAVALVYVIIGSGSLFVAIVLLKWGGRNRPS
jgi:ABC-type multidrug transport system permease subunit